MIEILPSLLAADFANLQRDIEKVTSSGARMLHFDVMDGHFVPNLSFGLPILKSIRPLTQAKIDVHLMVSNPDEQVNWFLEAGADCISVHQEASPHLDRTLNKIREGGAKAGVVLNPATPVSTLEHALHTCDFVLIMSVNPGFGGQKFLPYTLKKVEWLVQKRAEQNLQFMIEIDGGINRQTVPEAARAGVQWFVAGNAVFSAADPGSEFEKLRQIAEDARLLRA
jgi:ribulose-phosphate 3-epimerase